VDRLDCYQLWAVHVPELFDKALEPGGWMEGVQKAREEGLFRHLGVTGHADSAEIKRWVDSGYFEMITVPFNLLDASRLEGIAYALSKGVAVIAMNPLAGGLLGSTSDAVRTTLGDLGVESAVDVAMRYVASVGASALGGMTSAAEVEANVAALRPALWSAAQAEEVRARFEALLGSAEYVCTGCGYCLPCTENLGIPGILRLRNYHVVLQLEKARQWFRDRYAWDERFKANRCSECGLCEGKCPNQLPVTDLLKEVMATLGEGLD